MSSDGEVDFPRGGAPTLTPLEVRKIRATAERDTLFEKKNAQNAEPLKKKKKKTPKVQENEDSELEALQLSEKIVDTFSFKYLVPDLIALGYVSKLNLPDIVIGLPNGLSGYLDCNDVQVVLNKLGATESDDDSEDEESHGVVDVSELFTVGQFVPVVIKTIFPDMKGYKKLLLSTLPDDINSQLTRKMIQKNMMMWGIVTSVEDHGYLVSFGRKNFTGFLPKSPDGEDSHRIGTMRWMSVTNIKDKVLTVTTEESILETFAVTHDTPHFNSLLPGRLVSFTVTEVFDAGVSGKLFKSFDAVVENLHLSNRDDTAENLLRTKIEGRIIYINPKVKQIGVSLLPVVVSFSKNIVNKSLEYGDILDDCEVVKSVRGSTVLMRMPGDNHGIVRKLNLSDDSVQKGGKKYGVGTKHKCRIIGFHAMENLYLLSMKKSDLEKEFFRKEDVTPGMLVQGIVIRLENYGAIIKIADFFKGLCPTMHLADIVLKHPEKKYFPEKKVTCRVLDNDLEKKRITLTCKKSLVKTDLPIFTSYSDVKVGDYVHGFVSSIQPYGVFVSFYNGVVAILPKSEILSPSGTTVNQMFPIGKVVQCKVIYVDAENKKMTVSTKLNVEKDLDKKQKKAVSEISKMVSAKLVENEEGIWKLRQKDTSYVYMRKSHLSDFHTLVDEWDRFLKESGKGIEFKDLFMSDVDTKNDKTFVSRKHLYKKMDLLTFEQLSVGLVHCGVVTHIMNYGVFVEISPGLKGLALTKFLSDDYLKNHSELFTVGQSVIAKVADINEEKKRFILSLKISDVGSTDDGNEEKFDSYQGKELLALYFSQRQKLLQIITKSKNQEMKLLLSIDKEVILAKVTAVVNEGVMLKYEVNKFKIDGFIPKPAKLDGEFEVGGTCQCLVVFVDISKKMFIGYTDQDAITGFLKGREKKENLKQRQEQEDRMRIDCKVCYSNRDVVVALLPKRNYSIVYIPAKKHLNDVKAADTPINKNIIAEFGCSSEYGTIVTRLNTKVWEKKTDEGEKHIEVGSVVDAIVQNIKHHQLTVTLCDGKLQGRVHISQITDEVIEGQTPLKGFKEGQIIKGKVLRFKCFKSHRYLPLSHQNANNSVVELSIKPSDLELSGTVQLKEAKDFTKGDQVNCFIEKLTPKGVKVVINANTKAFIPSLLLTDDLKELQARKKVFHFGGAYQAVVAEYNEENEHLLLSRIGDPNMLVKNNAVVNGRVAKLLKNGVLIALPNSSFGMVHSTEMSDTFIDNPMEALKNKIDTFVRCKILRVDEHKNHIDLSLRCSRLTGILPTEGDQIYDRYVDNYDDIKEGDILRGFVKSSTKVGVFVSLSPSITGRVLIKNLSRYFIKDFVPIFHAGKVVKAKILRIDPTNNNIDLSLRGTDVNDVDPVPPPKRKKTDSENENEASTEKKRKVLNDDDEVSDDGEVMCEEECDSDAEDVDRSGNMRDVPDDESKDKPALELGTSFDWSTDDKQAENDGHSSESDGSSDGGKNEKTLKKSKRQKRAEKKAEEDYLHKAELALLDTERGLESAEDFDRLVLGSPNSSIVWIQYMAFHLHAAEVEKAIAVGRRALKTISFREEQEKLNVWVALLNLENSYGSNESLEKVFQEAIKLNEPKKIFFKLVDIYVKNDKKEEAEKLYQVMLKRFKTSKRVWTDYGWFLMLSGKTEEARKLLQRSMKSLPERKHVATIVKFGMMEYKMGDALRGRMVFESLLKNYPKRTDLWSIYLDMCLKQSDFEQVRNIFERAITLNLTSKKMKFIFKRYVNFEEQYGNEDTLGEAQRKSDEFMDQQMFQEMEE